MRSATLLLAALILVGCAGRHAVPAVDYSAADTRQPPVVRVAFDQNGDIYPPSGNAEGLTWPGRLRRTTGAFSIKEHFQRSGQLDSYDQDAIRRHFAAGIASHLAQRPGARIIILIHGFNNSYASASGSFDDVRRILVEDGAEEVILQVYWDGLQDPPVGLLPFWFWPDSMTYSNRAGQCGLRELVRLFPAGTDVTMITHSRGAAVAMSVFANPVYDSGIDSCGSPSEPPAQLGDVRLASFAPAIGDGHVLQQDRTRGLSAYPQIDGMIIGFDPNDPATGKRKLGIDIAERRMGDTRLGANELYYREFEKGGAGRVQREQFTQPDHSWSAYLGKTPPDTGNAARAKCVLWAAYAISSKPESCAVRR